MPIIDPNELNDLLDEANLPADVLAVIKRQPHLLQHVLATLGNINFRALEIKRAYVFLLLADRSSSVLDYKDTLVGGYQGTLKNLKPVNETITGTLFVGCTAISTIGECGEVILPITQISAVDPDASFAFEPEGGTNLYDTLVMSQVALRVLIAMAKREGITLVAMTYLLSDGHDEHSKLFTAAQAAAMIRLMTTGRIKHRFAAVSINAALKYMFTATLDIPADAIREVVTEDELTEMFKEMGQSVSATSKTGKAGGF